jgi:hypothetical protein
LRILRNMLMRALFYPAPALSVSEEEARQFEALYERAMRQPNKIIDYRLPAPKHKFLFIFRNRVAVHKPDEPMAATWLLYKLRTRFSRYPRG